MNELFRKLVVYPSAALLVAFSLKTSAQTNNYCSDIVNDLSFVPKTTNYFNFETEKNNKKVFYWNNQETINELYRHNMLDAGIACSVKKNNNVFFVAGGLEYNCLATSGCTKHELTPSVTAGLKIREDEKVSLFLEVVPFKKEFQESLPSSQYNLGVRIKF